MVNKYSSLKFPFLEKVVEMTYLDPFQMGFRRGHNREVALIVHVDDYFVEPAWLVHPFHFSVTFRTFDHGILLN